MDIQLWKRTVSFYLVHWCEGIQLLVTLPSKNISGSEFLKTCLVGIFFFPVKMCDRLCFWFLCEYQQLLEISRANRGTVHVGGQSERSLSPLVVKTERTEKDRSYHRFLGGLIHILPA